MQNIDNFLIRYFFFHLAILLYNIPRITTSDYLFDVLRLFLAYLSKYLILIYGKCWRCIVFPVALKGFF